ncbi:MAG: patatin-like protein [Alphaproteobacteria bacterium]|nr:MAG: patatin-like protein [Alphaproteobacteria bacterium]
MDESASEERQTQAPVTVAHERELRLALVCYGGVSLAVYMHGITREILKLVRASRAYHAITDEASRATARYDSAVPHRGERDSEDIYFALLQAIGGSVSLRVVVDVVAGASAGGINAIMLARALAHDLSLDHHRDFWLDLADVTELLAPEARAGRMSKPYMRPFFWLMARWQRRRAERLGAAGEDPEVLEKLSLFMRSRWFEPPFSGQRMSEMMLDALLALGEESGEQRSLVPHGLPLELFVTATDFWGHRQAIRLHDPPQIEEREHRLVFRFHHVRHLSGECDSRLGAEDIASLAFAARATSSYPGAFPPARLAEMDVICATRGVRWESRDRFVAEQFRELREAGEDPEDAAFIDGSVLMNKPISVALEAVQCHVAHREVDRRLVYLEPNPETRRATPHEVPGFFKTIKGALSDIPRNQPIRDDLEWLSDFNEQVRLRRQVVEAVKPNVMRLIAATLGERLGAPPDAERLARWREAANEQAAADAAYAYDGYARLKVVSALEELASLLRRRGGLRDRREAERLVTLWAKRQGIRSISDPAIEAQTAEKAAWVVFLRHFDIRYRQRRLRFLIRRLNELYQEPDAATAPEGRAWIDRIKALMYEQSEGLARLADGHGLAKPSDPDRPMDALGIASFFEKLAETMDLPAADAALDRLVAECCDRCPGEGLARELIVTYLGFAFYDVVTFPMAQRRDLETLEEIKVDRISVNDANTLRKGSARQILKGVEFGNFGAFFSRRFRENDYLWGRLTGAERLVDIVVSAVPEAVRTGRVDPVAIKKRLFLAILEAETPHLPAVAGMIADLRRDAERL